MSRFEEYKTCLEREYTFIGNEPGIDTEGKVSRVIMACACICAVLALQLKQTIWDKR